MSKFLFIPIILVCILAVGNFALLPRYQYLETLKVQIAEKESELASREEYFSELRSLSKELDKYSEEFSKINFALPSSPNFSSLFEFLQNTCSGNRLILKKIGLFTTSPSKLGEKIKESQVGVEVSGTFQDFMSFLSTVETSARLVEVSNISFTSSEEGNIFSFNLMIKVHSL